MYVVVLYALRWARHTEKFERYDVCGRLFYGLTGKIYGENHKI